MLVATPVAPQQCRSSHFGPEDGTFGSTVLCRGGRAQSLGREAAEPLLLALLCLLEMGKEAARGGSSDRWAALRRGSPASSCGMNSSPEPAGSRTRASHGGVHGRWWLSQGCWQGFPPKHRLLLLTAQTRSASRLPAAAAPLMSAWRAETRYPLSGAKLFSSTQKMRSCLPSRRTQLKSCSCPKPVFFEHFRGESGFLLLISGSGSDLLGILLPATELLHDSVSL